jgi:tryptophan synthase alpha chain
VKVSASSVRAPSAEPSRLRDAFARAAAEGRAAFIAYLTAGDPSGDATVSLAKVLERAGANILELGVPFSDPIADGPVLQRSAARALAHGTTLTDVFAMARRIRDETALALVLFTYLNPLVRFGIERAGREARSCGFDGVLVTDLPPEEAPRYQPALRAAGLDTVFLVSPTSTAARMSAAARLSSGFLYVVSRSGITGVRGTLDRSVTETVRRARRAAPALPLAIGFGISTPQAARRAAELADGVVVGSALVLAAEQARAAGISPEEAVGRLAAALAGGSRKSPTPGVGGKPPRG